MNTKTIEEAQKLWTYMSSFVDSAKVDAIVVCCSYDLRVCDYACQLLKNGISNKLVLSGNTGNWTRHIWNEPEAEVFKNRALGKGVHQDKIILEKNSTNFGENIIFSKKILSDVKSVMFVTKPSALLRVKLTVEAQWPEVSSFFGCPDIKFPNEISNVVGVLGVINEMVGDIERIQKYPEFGFQSKHEIPEDIMSSWVYLLDQGFTEHLLDNT